MNINKTILLVEDNPQDEKLILRAQNTPATGGDSDLLRRGAGPLGKL